jgi:nitrite reductase/ring-hydroxylating ferredoxin subunit/DMSO/TMAO reductase YedYZ heme-binding membrane subunit
MNVRYQAVLWNRQKRAYDSVLVAAVAAYLAVFAGAGASLHPNATAETLLIRAFGTAAFLLLHVILAIGPLCRLSPRFLPLLYNRRHMGVTMFLLALAHGVFAVVQFHALGDANPVVSVLTTSLFQPLGLAALVILFLMAATSHDYWLHVLSPVFWKTLHMAVYAAYALLVAHVSFGALQSETCPEFAFFTFAGLAVVTSLHLAAAWKETRAGREAPTDGSGSFDAGEFDSIPEGRARVITVNGERIAVFRHRGEARAISNVCRHQNGPLGEGRIVDGCVTCPWHGYQYDPATGASPPPFNDRVPVYETRVCQGRVYVNPNPKRKEEAHAGHANAVQR